MEETARVEFVKQLFDSLDEIVYLADMDNYTICYMNRRARRELVPEDGSPVEGRLCYELLQGRSSPCPFCTNDDLRPGEYVEWICKNPKLGRLFSAKDTMLTEGPRRLRLELAVDLGPVPQYSAPERAYRSNEKLLNEALGQALSCYDSQKDPLQVFLAYIGSRLGGQRMYIFEGQEGETVSNTYEWCAPGVEPQRENLQHVNWDTVENWYRSFHRGEHVILYDLEDIRAENPDLYRLLKPQGIHSLMVCPIVLGNQILGFFGVDNPPMDCLFHISTILDIMSQFILSMLQRRDLLEQMERISYYDQLTGALNRHGLMRTMERLQPDESVGILYCDVTGLKKINDTQGHEQGDALLRRAHAFLVSRSGGRPVYRMGGDEFVVLCQNVDHETFEEIVARISDQTGPERVDMAVGHVWQEQLGDDFLNLLSKADQRMYADKYQRRQDRGM